MDFVNALLGVLVALLIKDFYDIFIRNHILRILNERKDKIERMTNRFIDDGGKKR